MDKTQPTQPTQAPQTIDYYIASQPEAYRDILQQIREIIHNAAPQATEAIKYQMPTFVWKQNLIHFAWNKNHLGLYPTPEAVEHFEGRLNEEGYKYSKGAIQFPWDRPIPLDFIREITLHRVQKVSGQ